MRASSGAGVKPRTSSGRRRSGPRGIGGRSGHGHEPAGDRIGAGDASASRPSAVTLTRLMPGPYGSVMTRNPAPTSGARRPSATACLAHPAGGSGAGRRPGRRGVARQPRRLPAQPVRPTSRARAPAVTAMPARGLPRGTCSRRSRPGAARARAPAGARPPGARAWAGPRGLASRSSRRRSSGGRRPPAGLARLLVSAPRLRLGALHRHHSHAVECRTRDSARAPQTPRRVELDARLARLVAGWHGQVFSERRGRAQRQAGAATPSCRTGPTLPPACHPRRSERH